MSSRGRDVWIIGVGKMGLALGSQLLGCGWAGSLTFTGRRPLPPPHPLFHGSQVAYTPAPPAGEPPAVIIIATSDAAIGAVVNELERRFASSPGGLSDTSVVHTSGVVGSEVLSRLSGYGAAVASLHPLVSIADPERDAPRLRGAWYGVEGDAAGAATAGEIVQALGGQALTIGEGDKALYHAAAVFASNYLVALMNAGERLMQEAGVDAVAGRAALGALASGALENVAAVGPAEALTGPVSRGDAATVELHLRRLSVEDRLLYSVLAREALRLSVARGLPAEAAKRISDLIESELP